jgi:glycine cleavage system H protein
MNGAALEGLRFSVDHCWVRLDASGTVTIGLTDFAQEALGKIVFADLPEVGEEIAASETIGEVESTKAVSEVYAPLGGKVVAVNIDLEENPGLLNTDPYASGWICTLSPSDSNAFGHLLDAAAYTGMIDTTPESEPSTKD